MSHQVVYRKYRSRNFLELKSQEHISSTLSRQIKNNAIGHAYLFFGPRGTGKTSTARIFAKTVNCLNPKEVDGILISCEECVSCQSFNTDEIDILELDAASNRGIEDARLLKDKVYTQPISHRYKVIILDEAHMLTREAVNSLLKIIEEPPEYIIFIFCTTEFHKIPITISSRCQRFKFSLASVDDITDKLKSIIKQEGKDIAEDKLRIIAKLAKGSFRDSESLLEQVFFNNDEDLLNDLFLLYSDNSIINSFTEALFTENLQVIWTILSDIERIQGDVTQLIDISLDTIKENYDAGKIKFEQYLDTIRLKGSLRNFSKEEFMFKYCNLHSIQQEKLPVIEPLSPTIVETLTENPKVEPKQERPSEKIVVPVTKVEQSREEPKKESHSVAISADTLIEFFKPKVGIYNILTKSKISFAKEGSVIIKVSSLLHKIFLEKNDIIQSILGQFKDIQNVEITGNSANNPETTNSSNAKSPDKDSKIKAAEEIFGSKFK